MYSSKKLPLTFNVPTRSIRGFTLIELLVVITIIAILAGITFGISSAVQDSQARSRAQAEIAIISQALETFKSKSGDYPWTSGGGSADVDNGKELFQALVGWMQFERPGTTTTFETKSGSDVPTGGPDTFVDISKLTYVTVADLSDGIIEDYNPEVDLSTSAPTNLLFIDPWGKPYVYVHDKSSGSWDNFGYVLYSRGPDLEDSPISSNGVMTDSIRNNVANADNIYAGE